MIKNDQFEDFINKKYHIWTIKASMYPIDTIPTMLDDLIGVDNWMMYGKTPYGMTVFVDPETEVFMRMIGAVQMLSFLDDDD